MDWSRQRPGGGAPCIQTPHLTRFWSGQGVGCKSLYGLRMCGLAGYYLWEKGGEAPRLEEAFHLLAHRGPDARGAWIAPDGRVGFAHTRLSILDLSEAAHQPFHLEHLHLIYNGEIYNYRALAAEGRYPLKTRSDTEVILWGYRSYGEKVPLYLRGMFAFALYDETEEKCLLVRDPYGIKPLYVAQRPEGLYFASELKVLRSWLADLTPEPQAIALYLHLGFIPAPLTPYKGVYKVRPGEMWVATPRGLVKRVYYPRMQLWQQAPLSLSREAAVEAVEAKLREAVRSHLVSDVPVGLFLSGGTDSSLVAAFAREAEQKIQAFSIGFAEAKYNELPYAEAVSRALDIPLQKAILSVEEALPLLIEMPKWYDEPFGDYSAVPTYLVSRLAASQVKVVLAGDGGDELFGGYRRYELARKLYPIHWAVPHGVAGLAPYFPSRKGRRLLRLLDAPRPVFQSHLFSQEQDAYSWGEVKYMGLAGHYEAEELFRRDRLPADPFLAQAAWEFLYYLPEDLLMKVDRASMQHSLEVRVPLLDREVVELAWRLPVKYKYPGAGQVAQYKPLLRAILRRFLPAPLVERHKWGFALPLPIWMRWGPLHEWMRAMTDGRALESQWGISPGAVEALWRRYEQGEEEISMRLWLLAQLGAFGMQSAREGIRKPERLYSRQA